MTISGKQVYESIKSKISEVESEQTSIAKEVNNLETDITELVNERENAYIMLANTYLPGLDADSIQNTIHEVQHEVKKIFESRANRRKALEQLLIDLSEERALLKEKLESVDDGLEEKAKERDSTQKLVLDELSSNSEYAQLTRKAGQVNETLEQNKNRYHVFEEEAKNKLSAYNNNPLFRYLLNKDFGTPAHKGNFITRRLDNLVASLINFKEQRGNYDFLHSMPDAIKQEIDAREKDLKGLTSKIDKTEEQVEQKYGLPKIMGDGKKLSDRKDAILADVGKVDGQHRLYVKERAELENTKGEYHKHALARLKEYLKGDKLSELKARAKATNNPEDDRLVSRLEEIDSSIKELKTSIKEKKGKQDKLSDKLSGLNKIERTYTDKDYESSRSYFPDSFNINSLLLGYILGKSSTGQVDSEISNHQKFKPRETYSGSGSTYRPSSGGFRSGGGFGGGGFRSGGGFRGGGFRSGGGF